MKRKQFIKGIVGSSLFMSIQDISIITNALEHQINKGKESRSELASFGAVHLNNTSLEKAITFWTKVIGMKMRLRSDKTAEFGTEDKTLVVVNQSATSPFQDGFSGLYHFAIHLSSKQELAKAIIRLQQYNYAFSPIDHTMTQSLYLKDFDNVMVELALETPDRFKRVISDGGLFIEDMDGTIRSASAPLDINVILNSVPKSTSLEKYDRDSKIGHLHFYAHDVTINYEFYKKMGFSQFNYLPQYKYADLGAGGMYQHRLAMNSWHGNKKPLSPKNNAGLKYYQIIFNSKSNLQKAVSSMENVEEKDGSYWATDPTGIKILLTSNK